MSGENTHKKDPLNERIAEGTGKLLGTIAIKPIFEGLALAATRYSIIGEVHHLSETVTDGKPAIIAINHIGPVAKEGKLSLTSGATPDVFIQQNVIEQVTGRRPITVAINNAEWGTNEVESAQAKARKRMKQAFGRGFMKGAGTLPVEKSVSKDGERKRNYNRRFVVEAQEAIDNGTILTFFAEGEWRRPQHDYSKEIQIQSGAATIAKLSEKRHPEGIPIIPTYIHCSDEWDSNRNAYIYFGTPISTLGKDTRQITLEISEAIVALQQEAIRQNPTILSTIVRS